jgi:hypothetical protein
VRDNLKLYGRNEKSIQIAITSVLIFFVCFFCLNMFNQNDLSQEQRSLLLPLVLNAIEPYLITGNIQRLQPELEQLILGTSIERIDIHGADSAQLASIRNLDLSRPPSSSLREFSSAIVLDDALAATVILQEYLAISAARTWPNLLISFACAIAAAIGMLFLNTLQNTPPKLKPINSELDPQEVREQQPDQDNLAEGEAGAGFVDTPLPLNREPKGHQRLVLMIRLSDLKDQLVRTDEVDTYMTRIWRITERMAETYGISCVGVQSGTLVFTASGTNSAVALRHCIMFGWNLCRPEKSRSAPASLIAPIDFMGENPCHALALASNEELLSLQEQLAQIPEGEFLVCESLDGYLPKSVDAIPSNNNSLRILSIETRTLDLWKQQTQLP